MSAVQRLTSVFKNATSAATPYLKQAQTQAVQNYEKLLADNAQYIVKDPEAAKKLGRQYLFTNLAKLPSLTAQAQQEWTAVSAKLKKPGQLSGSEAKTYLLFAAELFAWYSVGEIVGRGFTILDYSVDT